MKIEITVALIAAIASLIVAIISLINSLISNRHSAKSKMAIESLKHDLELARIESEEKRLKRNLYIDSLRDAITAIQRLKDTIERIINAYTTAHYSEVAVKNICNATKKIVDSYEKNCPILEKNDRELFHSTKGISINIENYILSSLKNKEYASELTNSEKEHLRKIHQKLTDIQRQLQDSLGLKFYDEVVE